MARWAGSYDGREKPPLLGEGTYNRESAASSKERYAAQTAAIRSRRSPHILRFFRVLFARDLAASFHAVRCAGDVPKEPALVIFANHPSWWDGELLVWMAATLFAGRTSYAPMSAAMVERYPFFRKLGAFGVSKGYRGAATFLSVGKSVLSDPNGVLFINAEGHFRDVRERPLIISPGLFHLARSAPSAHYVPLAIEIVFWDERRPNLLLRFGEPLKAAAVQQGGINVLRDALTLNMNALAAQAKSRDPTRFRTLLEGKAGINPFYDVWRRANALLRGRRFEPAHGGQPHL